MSKPKLKYKLFLLMCIAVIALGLVALAQAYVRPNNPTMDYVPQNHGIYDTNYSEFKESDCRACHGATTAWRHHATEYAVRGQCSATCHDPAHNPTTDPVRDCKVCHVDSTWVQVDAGYGVGNLGLPHHRSRSALIGTCTACHDSTLVSDLNAVEPPQFAPTDVTPKPVSCENCHWPTGNNPDEPPPLADWNLWTVFPKPTTWPDSLSHPAPIAANGPVQSGDLNVSKAYRPVSGTEHMDVFIHCEWCHGTSPGGGYQMDPTNPYAIRACENCHDIYTLHYGIGQEHTTQGIGGLGLGGYTIDGVLNRIVTQDQKCVACHGDVMAKPMPSDPGITPVISTVEPPMGSAGITVSLVAGIPNFGEQGEDDIVAMQQGTSDWIPVPIVSWNPDRIEFELPGAVFAAGIAKVRVAKRYWAETLLDGIGNDNGICDPGEICTQGTRASALKIFYVRQHPILNSLTPGSGTWDTVVTINAVNDSFFTQREQFYKVDGSSCSGTPDCFGYSTYVELVESNDKYRVTEMTRSGWAGDATLGAWSHNQIKIRISKMPPAGPAGYGTFFDVNTGYFVPLADLYKGNWQLYVITDYFIDDGAVPGQYMLKHSSGHLNGQIDSDTLLYREISDPLPFFATDTPFISSRTPSSVKDNSEGLGAVYGINFGTTRDTSSIFIQACSGAGSEYPLTVVQWANTRVVFRVPYVVGSPKTGCVKVRVPEVLPPGSTDSNFSEPFTITP
jgi:hypothetical protein